MAWEHDHDKRRAAYVEKLRDPRWQQIRLRVFERDKFACQRCGDTSTTLAVHHRYYIPKREPWDYPLDLLVTLCEPCHTLEGEEMREIEADFILLFKSRFLANDLHEIGAAVAKMEMTHLSEVVASAIAWAISDPAAQRRIVDEYLASLP